MIVEIRPGTGRGTACGGGVEQSQDFSPDPELQPYLAQGGITCLVELLTGQQRGSVIRAEPLGALLRLIEQAQEPSERRQPVSRDEGE
jgi:hypothetical protein